MKRSNLQPTDSELEILQILWQNGAMTVRAVNDLLNEQREVGYTTTLKMMQIMLEKGLATRDTSQRTHIYSAAVEEQKTQQSLLKKFVNTTFRGSAMQLMLSALGDSKMSQRELDELRKMIEDKESGDL